MLLSGLGYLIKKTTKGLDPLIMQKPFADLILLDMRLKDTTGKAVCMKIKQHKLMRHVPVIMFSADTQLKMIAKEAGADDFIEKPFNIANLLEKIKVYI